MMKKEKQTHLNMRILGIKTIKFSQYDLIKDYDTSADPLAEFETNFNFKIDLKEEMINCLVDVKIKIIETNEYFAELVNEFTFKVKPLANFVKVLPDDKNVINVDLLHNLSNVSISTTRGILFEKLKGTSLQNDIYPLVNLSRLFARERIQK